ncbi:MAG: Fe-S cluster assembly transcriptional regulator IscR [Gammaproteobacteria bacterium]|nr:MAG: Fe-S cluster assembly transcriptional regulator IscR [Gammaproteobacteria bacterium]
MKLSTKGRYAVTALLDILLNQKNGCVPLSDIVNRQNISLSYLEQLFSKLKKAELVKSIRGPGGGYVVPQDQINILTIICAVDEKIEATNCQGEGNCHNDANCLTHKLWTGLNRTIDRYLSGITLISLVADYEDVKKIKKNKFEIEKQRKVQQKSLNSLVF